VTLPEENGRLDERPARVRRSEHVADCDRQLIRPRSIRWALLRRRAQPLEQIPEELREVGAEQAEDRHAARDR
jgi:hypothetical protein